MCTRYRKVAGSFQVSWFSVILCALLRLSLERGDQATISSLRLWHELGSASVYLVCNGSFIAATIPSVFEMPTLASPSVSRSIEATSASTQVGDIMTGIPCNPQRFMICQLIFELTQPLQHLEQTTPKLGGINVT